jgi:branched-chain amino acid transport system permease protein
MKRWLFILFIVLALAPIGLHSGQTILRIALVFIMLSLGLNLILGVAGLLDFGFAASFGLAAFSTALFTSRMDLSIILLAGGTIGAFLGWLKSGLARRLRSDFFATATLAFGLLIRQVIVNLQGMGGIGGIPAPHFLTFGLVSQTSKYYLVLGIALLAALACQRWIESRSGRAWNALSDDETAALAAGVNVGNARASALILGSMWAGIGGALYASTLSFVEPDMMAFHVSSMILTMVILGGAGNVTGAVIGAVAIILYDKMFVPQFADLLALVWPANWNIGSVPDIRGASFFNFGIALYLTVWFRARKR